MKLLKTGLVFSCFALFIFACNQAANTNNTAKNTIIVANNNANANINSTASTPADELATGKSVYMETCVKCHKEDGTGGISEANGKKINAVNFTSEGMKKESDEDLIEEIENGIVDEGMPAFKGRLTDAQIKSVVKFIRKEFQGK